MAPSIEWVEPFDPFMALGLERNASPKTIKAKYHELARKYHPNRNQGLDASKVTLSEYFYNVHQAWLLLCDADGRRRYLEVLSLYDEHESVAALVEDLLQLDTSTEQHGHHRRPSSEGHMSSDADDDDLSSITGLKRRETFADRPTRKQTLHESIPEESDSATRDVTKSRKPNSRLSQLRGRVDSGRDLEGHAAAERRKRSDRLRTKEHDAFNVYANAMTAKWEAEQAAERAREQFERARWRREYFERAPRETSQRLRLINIINRATKAFTPQQQPVRRRNRSIASQGGQTLSTGDPLQNNNQFLGIPQRHKSVRGQGYSSDISVDQTSSDEEEENSSDKGTSPSRSPRPSPSRAASRSNHKRIRSGDTLANPLNIVTRKLPTAKQDPISPITGPAPRVLIRQPTNLNEIMDAIQSGEESASGSSRSPSPQPDRSFKLVPAMTASEMFGGDSERKGRSRSAERHAHPVNGAGHGGHGAHTEGCMFRIKQVGAVQHQTIPLENVHELPSRVKEYMLGAPLDAESKPEDLMKKLEKLDPLVANRFMVKPDIKKDFRFRLVYNHREVVNKQHQSFIALSYRRKRLVEKHHRHFTLPLESEMFQAVWDERVSDTEGVWIDQICIDQDNNTEKTISMSAMDLVYHSARLVVVALDDIDLESHEGRILEAHMEEFNQQVHVPANKRFRRRQRPYLEARDDLFVIIRKILRSSWFKRAWCRHEMRLAKEHIFLVPCRSPGTWSGRGVLRFTGKCLTHFLGLATEMMFEPAIEAVKPALYAFFRDRSKLSEEHHRRSHHGNFTTVVAEVFAMEAGGDPRIPDDQRESDARKDKISIILNTMECGLTLDQTVRSPAVMLQDPECKYMLLLLALAARDPGALCSVGHPLKALPRNLASSWLLEPTNVDSGLNNYRTLNRLPEASRISTGSSEGQHFVELELNFMQPKKILRPVDDPEAMTFARQFFDACEKRQLGRNRKRYLLNDGTANYLFGSMKDVYIQLLVCIFECGPDWMNEVCQTYGVSRWRVDMSSAYDLMLAFKNTSGKWPEEAWKSEAAGFIIDLVNFLVIRGMPQRQITRREEWRPVCVETPSGGGRVVTFVPPGHFNVAVPTALLDSDYLHLARLWVMEPHGTYSGPDHNEWTLAGKSVLFSDATALDLLEADNAMIRRGQRVFGKTA